MRSPETFPRPLRSEKAKSKQCRELSYFGCRGDGATAARSMAHEVRALQSALDWAGQSATRALCAKVGAVYAVDKPLRSRGWLDLAMLGAQIMWHEDGGGLHYDVRPGPVIALAKSYNAGGLDLHLVPPGLPGTLRSNTIIKITSDAIDPANRDKGAERHAYRMGLWARLGKGSTPTHLRLAAPLSDSTGILPASRVGDEPTVAAFTPRMDARVMVLPPDTARISGGMWGYRDGMKARWQRARVIVLRGGLAPQLHGIRFDRSYDAQIRLVGTFGARLWDIQFAQAENNTLNGQLGYGLSDGGYGTELMNSVGENCRHIYTTNSVKTVQGSRDFHDLLGVGRVSDGVVRECSGRGGRNGLWDTHHDADGIRFERLSASDADAYGATLRGRDLRIDDFKTRKTWAGIRIFTEYQGGDREDDFFTAGKTKVDFTTSHLSNLDLECQNAAISISHATVQLAGTNRVRSENGPWLEATGGWVAVAGTHDVHLNGGLACVHLKPPHSAAYSVWGMQTKVQVEAGARIMLDARLARKPMRGFVLAYKTGLDIHGHLHLRLPRGSVIGDLQRVRCFGTGRLVLSVEGVPDAVLTKTVAEACGTVIETEDASAWWYDPADGPARWLRPMWQGDWHGNGPWIPPGLQASGAMVDAGHGKLRLVLNGQGPGCVLSLGPEGTDINLPRGKFSLEMTCFLRLGRRRYVLRLTHAKGRVSRVISADEDLGPPFVLHSNADLWAWTEVWATRGGYLPAAL